MGYSVETNGRLLLPEALEAQAFTGLRDELASKQGWFAPDLPEGPRGDSLGELARLAGAHATRDGDWLRLTTDREGDPKWSEQATAFYLGLGRWVRQGQVQLYGEDGAQWSYRYSADGVTQLGTNGWDGSESTTPGTDRPEDPTWSPEDPGGRIEDHGDPHGPVFTYPGQQPRPAPPPRRAGPAWPPPPGGPHAPHGPPYGSVPETPGPWGADEPAPAGPGRRIAMALALVVGVLLIVGLALLVSGM